MPGESWYFPEDRRDAVDCLCDLTTIFELFQDTLPHKAGEEFVLSEDGASGFGFLLMFMRDTVDRCAIVLGKEV